MVVGSNAVNAFLPNQQVCSTYGRRSSEIACKEVPFALRMRTIILE